MGPNLRLGSGMLHVGIPVAAGKTRFSSGPCPRVPNFQAATRLGGSCGLCRRRRVEDCCGSGSVRDGGIGGECSLLWLVASTPVDTHLGECARGAALA